MFEDKCDLLIVIWEHTIEKIRNNKSSIYIDPDCISNFPRVPREPEGKCGGDSAQEMREHRALVKRELEKEG